MALAAWLLRSPLGSLDLGLWGPADPWRNGDFVGNAWCWWRTAEHVHTGVEWVERLGWPDGGDLLVYSFPNRLDAWLVAPFLDMDAFAAWWNRSAALHVALAVAAAALAGRLAGAHPVLAASATSILVLSPTLLHELAGGRMATLLVWPGVLALAAGARALRTRTRPGAVMWGATTGGLLALQAFGYAYHALVTAFLLVPPLLAPPRDEAGAPAPSHRTVVATAALVTGAAVAGPYAMELWSLSDTLAVRPPPAGYTSLPLAGLFGLPVVPERFRVLPVTLLVLLACLGSRRARPWVLSSTLGFVLAVGPEPVLTPGQPPLWSPLDVLSDHFSVLARMHHPVRIAPLALSAGTVAVALGLDDALRTRSRLARAVAIGAALLLPALALPMSGPVSRVTTWASPTHPPGIGAARWIADHTDPDQGVVDVFGGPHIAALSLQPWHRRPLLETAEGHAPPPASAAQGGLRTRLSTVEALARGVPPPEAAWKDLSRDGLRTLLFVERFPAPPQARTALALAQEAGCEVVFEDDEASVCVLPPPTGGDAAGLSAP